MQPADLPRPSRSIASSSRRCLHMPTASTCWGCSRCKPNSLESRWSGSTGRSRRDRPTRSTRSTAPARCSRCGETAAAEAACREALKLKRNSAEACQVLGHALCDLGRPEEAIAAYRDAMRYNADAARSARSPRPRAAAGWPAGRSGGGAAPGGGARTTGRAGTGQPGGRAEGTWPAWTKPSRCYREALRRQPDDPALHYNLSLVLLLAGRFADGLGANTSGASGPAPRACPTARSRAGRASRSPGARC